VADVTLDSKKDAEVVVEVEAGSVVFGNGTQYKTGLLISDLEAGTTVPFTPAAPAGTMSLAPWTTESYSFVYTVKAADLAAHAGNLCRVYAYLLVGLADFDATFVESPLFLILP
jgi:hypothetical protein